MKFQLFYRWHGGDSIWTAWIQGPEASREDALFCHAKSFADKHPTCEFEWVIVPVGEQPHGAMPANWQPRAGWWWEPKA